MSTNTMRFDFTDSQIIDADFVEDTKREKSAERKKTADGVFTKKWWDRMFLRMLATLVVLAFTVSTLGVLAIPVVMALIYSPVWVMLYGAYLLILLLFINTDK